MSAFIHAKDDSFQKIYSYQRLKKTNLTGEILKLQGSLYDKTEKKSNKDEKKHFSLLT